MTNSDKLIAYIDVSKENPLENRKVVVQNIFDKSLLYSWTTGGGSSFLGNYLNYLSSPLSFLIFLFNKEDIAFAITFISFPIIFLSDYVP